MLTKTLFGLAADLLRAVDVAISAMADLIQRMMMSNFGTIWVSDLHPRPLEAQHGDTNYALEQKLTRAMTWQEKRRQNPKGISLQ